MTQTPTRVTLDVVLRRALADRRMSGRELARRTGLSPARVARSLRGDRDLTVAELSAVAVALGVTIADLLPAEVAA